MDALTATKAVVFVLDVKTIPALHITNQPRQKFKLALSAFSAKTISRPATGRATDEPTDQPSQNRRE